MRIRDWSSDVCSSDLKRRAPSEPPRSHLRDEIAKLLVDRLHLRFVTLCRLLARVELAHHHFEERGGTAEEGAPHLGELNVRAIGCEHHLADGISEARRVGRACSRTWIVGGVRRPK